MGLIFLKSEDKKLVFREKIRFDPYNPATIEVTVDSGPDGPKIEVSGENNGKGPYQESHVMRMIFEFVDRMENDLECQEKDQPEMDPHIAEELNLLHTLHEKGVLTDHEFRRAKDKLLL